MSTSFVEAVIEHVGPAVEPHGFSTQPQSDSAVLFHCDGHDSVDRTLARHPAWREPLLHSYGGETIPCLDLWVQLEDGQRVWSFEVFGPDVEATNDEGALRRLDELRSAPANEWAKQLALVLSTYLNAIEERMLPES